MRGARYLNLKGRLKHISDVFNSKDYDFIIDTCCDHGHLGLALSKKSSLTNIFLIDINEGIIHRLNQKKLPDNVKAFCLDAQLFELERGKSLVIVAGVGGELAIKIISSIINKKHVDCEVDFIIAANNKNHLVRKKLQSLGFKSYKEDLIFDNEIGYEIIFSKFMKGKDFDSVGKQMFDHRNKEHLIFAQKKMKLYQVKSRYQPIYESIYQEYDALLQSFKS